MTDQEKQEALGKALVIAVTHGTRSEQIKEFFQKFDDKDCQELIATLMIYLEDEGYSKQVT